MTRWLPILAIAAASACVAGKSRGQQPSEEAGIDFFEKSIRPLLVEHCHKCHAKDAEKIRGGLLLDSREGWLKGGDSGPAIVPGDAEASPLIRAIRYEDADLEMPPKGKLPQGEIDALVKWVAMGAPAPQSGEPAGPALEAGVDIEKGRRFWSFQPVARPATPAVRDAAWAISDIDRFILAQLEAAGIEPSGDADRRTLLRRATFDLTGLPPTPSEIDAFVNDESDDAFAKVVERLLASARFGERWGRHWLDVARFAESAGGGRSILYRDAWRYRDYVIDAFNTDKPYDLFVREQIAGDLMPYGDDAQRAERLIATGFLAVGPKNLDEQNKDQLRMDVVDEQLDTIGRSVLGLTLGCARCHDHKFDPIPTTDYYAMAAILRSTKTLTPGNVSGFVEVKLPAPPALLAAHERHAAATKQAEQRVKEAEQAVQISRSAYARQPKGIVADDAEAVKIGEWIDSTYHKVFVGKGYLHDNKAGAGSKSVTFTLKLPQSGEYEVRVAYNAGPSRAPAVPVTIRHARGDATVKVNQQQAPPIDDLFVTVGRYRFEAGAEAAVTISNTGADGYHVIVDAVQFIAVEDLDGAKAHESAANAKHAVEIALAESRLQQARNELESLKKQAPPSLPTAIGVREEDAGEIGDYHVLVRGVAGKLGEPVRRGFVQVAAPPHHPARLDLPDTHSGRLELAAWLTDSSNPLTARVAVNRVWQHLFGYGLVRTSDNFGSVGEPPTHPELLDHLAASFVEDGWSTKRLIRRIMLSRAYQMSASPRSPHAMGTDGENRLLWRMNRRRLEAEAIRDSMLFVSGRLDETMGGPGFDPAIESEYGYEHRSLRRSVYVPVFRDAMHEMMLVFDFADPNLVVGKRSAGTLPTQALFLMNSPFVLEQSEHAAKRLLSEEGLDDAGRVDLAYRRALGRSPTKGELRAALQFVRQAETDRAEQVKAWAAFCQALFASIDFRYLN